MKDIELTLLSAEDVFGNKRKNKNPLEVIMKLDTIDKSIQKYGGVAFPTDLAILTGGNLGLWNSQIYPSFGMNYWTTSKCKSKDPLKQSGSAVIGFGNKIISEFVRYTSNAIRPVLVPSTKLFYEIIKSKKELYNSIYTVQYGEYPQWVVSEKMQEKLEEQYTLGNLTKTKKTYTFSESSFQSTVFTKVTYDEYLYDDKKYINIKALPHSRKCCLKNGRICYVYDHVWLEVSPITWLIDFENERLISEYSLLSGIRFNKNSPYDKFEETEMYKYLNTYMLKDMLSKDKQLIQINLSSNEISSYEEKLLKDETLSKEELEFLKNAFESLKEYNLRKR